MKAQELAELRLDAANRIEAGCGILRQQAQAASTKPCDGQSIREPHVTPVIKEELTADS